MVVVVVVVVVVGGTVVVVVVVVGGTDVVVVVVVVGGVVVVVGVGVGVVVVGQGLFLGLHGGRILHHDTCVRTSRAGASFTTTTVPKNNIVAAIASANNFAMNILSLMLRKIHLPCPSPGSRTQHEILIRDLRTTSSA